MPSDILLASTVVYVSIYLEREPRLGNEPHSLLPECRLPITPMFPQKDLWRSIKDLWRSIKSLWRARKVFCAPIHLPYIVIYSREREYDREVCFCCHPFFMVHGHYFIADAHWRHPIHDFIIWIIVMVAFIIWIAEVANFLPAAAAELRLLPPPESTPKVSSSPMTI